MLKVRQICFIMAIYTIVSKLLLYPTQLSLYSGRDLLFSAGVDFLVQGVALWSVAFLASRTDKTLFELLSDTFGKTAARVIIALFGLFFAFTALVPLFEQQMYVHAIFYDTTPPLLVFLPVFFFLVYAGGKGFENMGRCADISLPVFLFSGILILFMSFSEVDFANLLPMLKTPPTALFGGSWKTAFRFAEPAYMLMFLGRFEYKKGDAAKIVISYAIAAAAVLGFLSLFYGIYAGIAPSRQFAVSKTALYFSAIDMIGRIDLFALYVLETVMLFALVLNIQLAAVCFGECVGVQKPYAYSLAVNAVLALILYLCSHFFTLITAFFADWAGIVTLVFATLAPALCWLLNRERANGTPRGMSNGTLKGTPRSGDPSPRKRSASGESSSESGSDASQNSGESSYKSGSATSQNTVESSIERGSNASQNGSVTSQNTGESSQKSGSVTSQSSNGSQKERAQKRGRAAVMRKRGVQNG